MQIPLEIRFRGMETSAALEEAALKHAQKLERYAGSIVSCRVIIEAPHKHHRRGKLYSVRVDLQVPGADVVASRGPSANHAHEDVHVALRDSFKAARRQLQDHVRVRRGQVKRHEGLPRGKIIAVDRERNCGRIATADGREIFFHRNSVVNADFDRLDVGAEIRFAEEPGQQGPQASTVHVVGYERRTG
jgi:cold shock CspA family protein/ribosome-associated translation inhibitor RaiA